MKQIFIVGNVGAAPVCRVLSDGREIMSFNVAVNEPNDKATWFGICARKQEKLLQYIGKGKQVAVIGRFDAKVYNNGIDYTIYADQITLCGGTAETTTDPQNPQE